MSLLPNPEPEFVEGRPNIYGIYHPIVNGWYVGKNESGVLDYMGSPGDEARKAIVDAHAAIGVGAGAIEREKHILWSPPDATTAECRDQEWIWIKRFRAEHDGPVFNKFPIEDRSNQFHWEHDVVTHVDRATNSGWPVVYMMMNSRPDADGTCVPHAGKHRCGRPWGAVARGLYWCKKIHVNEGDRVEWVYPPTSGVSQVAPYNAFVKDKFRMIHGEDSEA